MNIAHQKRSTGKKERNELGRETGSTTPAASPH
jgi:hypothetical protein